MRKVTWLLVLVFCATAAPSLADNPAGAFFNGKDLTGWEGLTELWQVKDGMLIGSTPAEGQKFNTFLCSKAKYKDFQLTFQIRLVDGKGNSGVQIRSSMVEGENEKGKFVVKGPQCDIGQGYWGSLYGERFGGMMKAAPKESQEKVKQGEFNDYYILCQDKHVTIKINGETTVDQDFPNLPDTGIIAWQLHAGPHMEVQFKNIEFKDLSTGK
jgi:hypothetical protein